jgi:NDP-sugar pyrophosphorylase family protein
MRGMILAGGLSTRLYPLTLDMPKPLVPVLDRPVVDHIIEYLVQHGVDEIVINVHYFADAIEGYIGDGRGRRAKIRYLREPELMGSAGAVKQVQSFFEERDETFVVIGCDDITDLNLEAAIAFHRDRNAEATIALAHAEDVRHYGVVVVGDDGAVQAFQEKPEPGTERSHLVNTGIYIFEPRLLQRIPAATFYDFGRQVFPELLAARAAFFGMRQDGYWCDIGTPSEYRRCHFDALTGRVRLRHRHGARLKKGVLIGPGAAIDSSVQLAGPLCIGSRCAIGAGAVVERSILWENVKIEPGAVVRDAVLADGVHVEAGSLIEGGEYGRNERVSTECSGRAL